MSFLKTVTESDRKEHVRYKVNGTAILHHYAIHPGNICKQSTFLVIAVISQPGGIRVRQAIRNTWGSLAAKEHGVHFFFVLGRIKDDVVQNRLTAEAEEFQDILQSNQFVDAYQTSTVKTLSLFQWCAGFCAMSRYVLRVDDDVWLNVPDFLRFLQQNLNNSRALGYIVRGAVVNRIPGHKHYVPREEYMPDEYPAYLSGAIFAVPTTYLPALISESHVHNSIFLDDVFVTGILMPAINLEFEQMPGYPRFALLRNETCPQKDYIAIHGLKRTDLYRYWAGLCYRGQKREFLRRQKLFVTAAVDVIGRNFTDNFTRKKMKRTIRKDYFN